MKIADLRRRLVRASQLASDETVAEAGRNPKAFLGADYAYVSGYNQALNDVLAVIRGAPPAWQRKYWPEDPST